MTATPSSTAPAQITVHGQYVKDLSFESPNAPQVFQPSEKPPVLNIGVQVQTAPLDTSTHEVVLNLKLDAKHDDKIAFIVELSYAGVFGVPSMPDETLRAFLLIEAPRLLFPFARNVVADAVRNGGFPQILLNPIDFMGLYQQQQGQMGAPAQGSA